MKLTEKNIKKLKKLNQTSKKILDYFYKKAKENDLYFKVDNDDTYMAVNINVLHPSMPIIAVAHNSVQYGDVMADPDVVFIYTPEIKNWMPTEYRNDYMGVHNILLYWDENEMPSPAKYNDVVVFVNTWMKNIIEQQELNF